MSIPGLNIIAAGDGMATMHVEKSEWRDGHITLTIARRRETHAGTVFTRIDLSMHEVLALALAAQRGATILRAARHVKAAADRLREMPPGGVV